jgi:hypothetical protein
MIDLHTHILPGVDDGVKNRTPPCSSRGSRPCTTIAPRRTREGFYLAAPDVLAAG